MRPAHVVRILDREYASARSLAQTPVMKFGDAPDLLLDALQACVDQAAGVEFKAFVDHMAQLPDIEAIVQGRSLQVPPGIDLQYGVATALVRRALQARDLMSVARDDYSFQRPSRREADALLQRLSGGEGDLHVALDTSGRTCSSTSPTPKANSRRARRTTR